MGQTVLLTKNSRLAEALITNLKIYAETNVIVFKEIDKALIHLSYHPYIDLFIAEQSSGGEDKYPELIELIQKQEFQAPLLILGQTEVLAESPPMINFKRSYVDTLSLIDKATSIIGTPIDKGQLKLYPYFPVSIDQCLHLRQTPCDVYIKIKKQGEDDYIKRFQIDDEIEDNDVCKYQQKGLKHLFIKASDRFDFLKKIAISSAKQMEKEELKIEQRKVVTENSMKTVQDMVADPTGYEPEDLKKVVSANLKSSLKIVKNYSKISDLVGALFHNKSSYMFKCAQLITYAGHHVFSVLPWGTTEHAEKIGFCALLHDIILKDDKFAKIRSSAELDGMQLAPYKKDIIRRHALMAANTVKAMETAPPDVAQIIQQHHGSVSGSGFAQHYASSLAPLAIVFIVLEEFVFRLLTFEDCPKEEFAHITPQILRDLKNFYTKPKYREVVEALESISF